MSFETWTIRDVQRESDLDRFGLFLGRDRDRLLGAHERIHAKSEWITESWSFTIVLACHPFLGQALFLSTCCITLVNHVDHKHFDVTSTKHFSFEVRRFKSTIRVHIRVPVPEIVRFQLRVPVPEIVRFQLRVPVPAKMSTRNSAASHV